jgi:hypothetical protein
MLREEIKRVVVDQDENFQIDIDYFDAPAENRLSMTQISALPVGDRISLEVETLSSVWNGPIESLAEKASIERPIQSISRCYKLSPVVPGWASIDINRALGDNIFNPTELAKLLTTDDICVRGFLYPEVIGQHGTYYIDVQLEARVQTTGVLGQGNKVFLDFHPEVTPFLKFMVYTPYKTPAITQEAQQEIRDLYTALTESFERAHGLSQTIEN